MAVMSQNIEVQGVARMEWTRMALAPVLLAGLLGACTVPPQGAAPAAPPPVTLDENVAAALRAVSQTLASAKTLTVNMSVLREGKLGEEQDILLSATSAVAMRRPDRMAGMVGSDLGSFSLWYDGTKVTVYNPVSNAYGSTPMTGDTDTVMTWLEKRLGIDIVVRPLLLSDPYSDLARAGTTGVRVGASLVRGTPVEHYAMRSPGVNWEIWISTTGPRLPRRVSVVDLSDPAQRRVIVEFENWNLAPRLTDAHFTFVPPPGAVEATPVLLRE
jgi:hypothetical protein